MTIDEILNLICGLSYSQGFYGRLYETLMEIRESDPEEWSAICDDLEAQDFKEPLDVILYFEG